MRQVMILGAVGVATILAGVVAGSFLAERAEHGGHGGDGHAVHWSYEGDQGPANWHALDPKWSIAKSGTHQSPIDLDPTLARQAVAAIDFHYGPNEAAVVNNGHTIQVDLAGDGERYAIVGGDRYDVAQFHFHAPSEHTVMGSPYPMEMHLVHKDAAGNLAVVGVFLAEGATNAELAPVFANMPAEAGQTRRLDGPVDLGNLLPIDRAFFRYDGSLTTPPCSEGVLWSVMVEPVEVSSEQIEAFRALYSGNARPVQPLHDRALKAGH